MSTKQYSGSKIITKEEILVYKPCLTSIFNLPLSEEKQFYSNNSSYLKNRQLLTLKNCPYCRATLRKEQKSANALGHGYGIEITHCGNCGWWCGEEGHTPIGGEPGDDFLTALWGYKFLEGTLATFKVDDLTIPVQILKDYIKKKPKVLYDLHPRKFEELIAAIFYDFFECEVSLTGQTVDGGVDLYLINGDQTYLVQAKRRSNPGSTEGVQVIRELAGVLLIKGHSRGIVVSTAEKFSSMAKKEACSEFLSRKGYKIDLMNYHDLLNAVKSVSLKKKYMPYWEELLRMPLEVSSMKHLLPE